MKDSQILPAHDWQKIRFVLIFERFPHFLMECVGWA
jgi:hypothetical protein